MGWNEIWWGLWAGLAWNVVVTAAAATWFDPSSSDWLVTLGTANELLGVVLVASPELLPRARRVLRFASGQSKRLARAVAVSLARLFPKGGEPQRGTIGTAVETDFALPIVVVGGKSSAKAGDLEREIAIQAARLAELENRVGQFPAQWQGEIRASRKALEESQRELAQRLADRNIRLRLLGLTYVVAGLILAWLGNVV